MLDDECFFGLISETLEASRSCDVREMARPVLGLIQRIQAESLIGLLPPLARHFYESLGPQCQPPPGGNPCLGDAAQSDHMCEGLFISLQSDGALQQQQAEMTLLNQQLELHTLAASAQYWAYSEALGGHQMQCGHHIISRQKLAAAVGENWLELDTGLQSLERLQTGLDTQLGQLQAQRSNWNRNHIDSLMRTEQTHSARVNGHLAVMRQLADGAGAVCRLEQYPEALGEEGRALVELLEQWLAVHGQWQASSSRISNVEQAVVELLDPEGAIDPTWLEDVQGLLEEQTCKVQRDLSALECEQQSKHRFVCTLAKETQRMQESVPRFHVRSLCADAQGQGQGKMVPTDVQLLCGHLRDSQRVLQTLFHRLVELRKDLCCERLALPVPLLSSWRQQLQEIQTMARDEVNTFFKSMDEFLQQATDLQTDSYETFAHCKGKCFIISYPLNPIPNRDLLHRWQ